MSNSPALGYYRKDCRLCHGTRMVAFLDFGMHPHSDGFLSEEQVKRPEPTFPLTTEVCADCGQVQINYIVSPAYLYGGDYFYDGAITETGRKHFLAMAADLVSRFGVQKDRLAIDIGSNVGLLLRGFKEQGLRVQGIDPTPRMTKIAIEQGLDTLTEVFSTDAARRIAAEKGKAAIMTGTNVIAHIDDMDDLMTGAKELLDDDGIFVIEAPYLRTLVEGMEYDTIYHQHLSYFSVKPLRAFFARHGLELFDVIRTTIHGGSIRLFVGRPGKHAITPTVDAMCKEEEALKLHDPETLKAFGRKAVEHRQALVKLLTELKERGKSIAGVGAPAKGSTMLNFCGINRWVLDFTTEKNKLKVGRYTPGTHIPILTDDELLKRQPDYALILPWNFATEIMKNLQAYKDAGGTFILPVPVPTVV